MKVQLNFDVENYRVFNDVTNMLRHVTSNLETKVLSTHPYENYFEIHVDNEDKFVFAFIPRINESIAYVERFDRYSGRIEAVKFVRRMMSELGFRADLLECKIFVDSKMPRGR